MNPWRRLRMRGLVRLLHHPSDRVRWRWTGEGLAVNGANHRGWRIKFGNGLWVQKQEKRSE